MRSISPTDHQTSAPDRSGNSRQSLLFPPTGLDTFVDRSEFSVIDPTGPAPFGRRGRVKPGHFRPGFVRDFGLFCATLDLSRGTSFEPVLGMLISTLNA